MYTIAESVEEALHIFVSVVISFKGDDTVPK